MAHAPSAGAIGLSAKDFASKALNDKKQFQCLKVLYGKESSWNPKAVNGSHYGIPQGNSIYLKTADPIEQIQWGLRYISNRYGNACNALNHFNKRGWH